MTIITLGLCSDFLITKGFFTLEDFIETEILNTLARRVELGGSRSSKKRREKEKEQIFTIETCFLSQNKQIINESSLKKKLNKRFLNKDINIRITKLYISETTEKEYKINIKVKNK